MLVLKMEESWREPLLRKEITNRGPEKSSAAVNMVFLRRISCLMRIAKCGDCFVLVLLSVLEVAIISQAGLVVGHFYNALISKNATLFLETVGQYVLWYSAEAICKAAQGWAGEWLAIGWRQKLTQAAHHSYCSFPSLCNLSRHDNIVDNPDERVTNEIKYLCQTLAELMMKTVAAPLMILYYSWWVAYHVGWFGPLVVYAVFISGAAFTRLIISPISRLVASQEKLEAIFRISHVRFRTRAEEIAMSDSAKYEEAKLDRDLQAALSNQRKLVTQHFLLGVTTQAYDYLGGVLNYCVLAIPVFGGLFDSGDSGELANLISNASFAVLQLIFSFSQVMDTAKLVSDLAGYTSRVGEFFEALGILPENQVLCGLYSKPVDIEPILEETSWDPMALENDGTNIENYVISPPTCLSLSKDFSIEISVHFSPPDLHEVLGRTFPGTSPASLLIVPVFISSTSDEEGGEVQDLDWCTLRNSVCNNELLGENSANKSRLEGSRPREFLLELMVCITQRLRNLGHWTEWLVSSTGNALSNMDESEKEAVGISRVINVASSSFSESLETLAETQSSFNPLDAVQKLLGYTSIGVGCVSLDHPRFGDNYILSTIFTTSPVKVFQSVLNNHMKELALSGEEHTESSVKGFVPSGQFQCLDTLTSPSLAIDVDHMTFFLPGSHTPVVFNLTLELQWGDSLLIMGATGCGKTSFLRTLCGLWPIHSGKIRMPPLLGGKCVLVLPQQPLMAKTGLAGQILYPESSPSHHILSALDILRLSNALEAVGLPHLLNHLNESVETQSDWADILSPGEQQLLALSRVFYHQPQLVILDEATSALSEDAEDAIYERMIGMGISIISVAHRSRVLRHHTKVLFIRGDEKGGWLLS